MVPRRITHRYLLCILLACSFAVPAAAQSSPSISIDPDCGPETTGGADERYEITVQGSGFEAGDDVEIYFAGDRQDDPDQEDVVADESGSFGTVIRPLRRPAGTYEVEALQRHGEGAVSSRAVATFTVPCPEVTTTTQPDGSSPTTTTTAGSEPSPSSSPSKSPGDKEPGDKKRGDKGGRQRFKPRLRFDSKVGPPGSVIQVVGRGFPRRSKLVLDWNVGTGSERVETSKKGRFSADVLIFPNDVLGPRRLVVRGARFKTLRIPFLVVASTSGPPDFTNR
jgi:hypothetical protein